MCTDVKIFALVLMTVTVMATTGTYKTPISLNPLIQSPIKLSGIVKYLYDRDAKFYSKVTLTDVADNTQTLLKDLIDKKLSVVFLTVASSHLGAKPTLTLNNLKFTSPSRWSYNVSIDDIIKASNESNTSFTADTELFRFQEIAMKVLENRYNFSSSTIQSKLGLTTKDFLAANEKQWIDIVGVITQMVINSRSEKMKLTPCYMAELLNKTLTEINAFTLNEVDLHLYNTSSLVDKLPNFENNTLARFYKSFNITPAEMASSSNVNISVIQSLELKDLIQLFTKNTLQKFHLSLTAISNKYQKSNMDISFPCPDEWRSFEVLIVLEAFENEARNMSITNGTLASLIQISYENVKTFSLQSIQQLIENKVKPAKKDKKTIEQTTLHTLTSVSTIDHPTKDNAFDIIESITNFTRIQLSTLYHWTNLDYQFSEKFSVADLVQLCSPNVHNYSLLTVANLNVGKATETTSCKSLAALREIWNRATINDLRNMSGSPVNIPSDYKIEKVLHLLTNSSSKFIFCVLNITSDDKELCSNISLHHLSLVTPHSVSHLMDMSFQDLINFAMHI